MQQYKKYRQYSHQGVKCSYHTNIFNGGKNIVFLTEYQLSAEITNQISLNSYMGSFMMMIFMMGLVFEIPLLAWVLSKLGLIDKAFLKQYRRHAVAVLLILAAAITPTGDPFTLSIVFIPLYLLYELAIKVVRN